MSLSKVIEIARAELGVTENPAGSNRVKYWTDFDPAFQGQPWCAAFLWWCFREAGESAAFFGGAKTASCGVLLRWYKEQGLTVPVEQVQPGDIVILNFHGTKDTEHCGLVVDVDSRYITTIEGNTSPSDGSQSNGGMVCEKRRYATQVVAVCRPKYKEDGPSSGPSDHLPPGEGKETGDDITGHWAEADIRWAMGNGLLRGYADGSMRPDQPVTRAELAVILRRFAKE